MRFEDLDGWKRTVRLSTDIYIAAALLLATRYL